MTKRKNKIIGIAAVFLICGLLLAIFIFKKENQKISLAPAAGIVEQKKLSDTSPEKQQGTEISPQDIKLFQPPLDRASERITKKKFGQYITPRNSPVQPERFSGYHTGTDFEIFPDELNADIQVKAVCDGKLLAARTASGYGGVAVESCQLDGEPITVVYGHLNIASVKFKVGDQIKAGDVLGSLGRNKSVETDGERKHLHLSIHKGSVSDIRGYVNSTTELSEWIDPCSYVCQ